MTASPDGRRLYFLAWRSNPEWDDYWIANFDTERFVFLRDSPPVPDCFGAVILPSAEGRKLQVVCSHRSTIHFFEMAEDGATLQNLLLQVPPPPRFPGVPAPRMGRLDGNESLAQAAFDPGGRAIILFKRDGRMLRVDMATRQITQSAAEAPTPGRWVSSDASALSPDGARFYVPYGKAGEHTDRTAQIAVFDTRSFQLLATITPEGPFWNLALGRDGHYLYATAPWDHCIRIIDTETGKQVGTLAVGSSPSLVLAGP